MEKIIESKICRVCKETKSINSYYNRRSPCKKCYNERIKQRSHRLLRAWIKYLPENPTCGVCGRVLKYFSGEVVKSAHFDHKNNGLAIKGKPSHWLRENKPIEGNIKIFRSCDFGILCYRCNRFIPTEGREKLLRNLIEYLK